MHLYKNFDGIFKCFGNQYEVIDGGMDAFHINCLYFNFILCEFHITVIKWNNSSYSTINGNLRIKLTQFIRIIELSVFVILNTSCKELRSPTSGQPLVRNIYCVFVLSLRRSYLCPFISGTNFKSVGSINGFSLPQYIKKR